MADTLPLHDQVPPPYLWRLKPGYEGELLQGLTELYGIRAGNDLPASQIIREGLEDDIADYHFNRGGCLLEELDDHSATVFFQQTAEAIVLVPIGSLRV